MADNLPERQSMAEHEMEMQRQMMSAPPVSQSGMIPNGPPPSMGIPPQMMGPPPVMSPGVMPPAGIPPPPNPPGPMPPGGIPSPRDRMSPVGLPPTGMPPPGNLQHPPTNMPPPGTGNMLPPPGTGNMLQPPGGNMPPPMGGGMPPSMGGNMPSPMGGNLPPPMGGNMPPSMSGNMPPPMGGNMSPQSHLNVMPPTSMAPPSGMGPQSGMGPPPGMVSPSGLGPPSGTNMSHPPPTNIPPPQLGKNLPPPPTSMAQQMPAHLSSPQNNSSNNWQAQENGAPGDSLNGGDDGDNDDDDSKSPINDENQDDDEKNKKPTEVVLPKVLEDVLALKDQRAAEFEGVDAEDYIAEEAKKQVNVASGVISTDYADAEGDSDDDADMQDNLEESQKKGMGKMDKNKRKKKRKKQNKKLRQNAQKEAEEKQFALEEEKSDKENKNENVEDDVTIEYIPERITIADLAPMYRQFYRVFEIFKLENKPKLSDLDKNAAGNDASSQLKKNDDDKTMEDDDDDIEEEKKDDKEKLSKRKLKKLTRLSVAELKQLVNRPDVVEMHDVTARDPKLLVQLKAHRNTVQVPRHWCFKRKYLQGKRGIEKPPFDLPAFIKKTGIMEMREALQEKDEAKSLKAKMRERSRPKMGKIDIDYQKLHDAFFKWQTKPRMTIHGDLYYEGKEFETRLKEKKPGDLSEELRIALGMPVGPNCHKIPPPWLIAQQRYGPPPSYPNLKIPGLNAPIPDGTSFGYHAGGWGKPPVDENGKPLYGDVFGTNVVDIDNGVDEGDIERAQWGELESESEESSEEEEEEGEDLVNVPDETGLVTPAEGLVTPSGLTSVPAGMETPDNIELRKKKIEAEMEDNETPVLYQVLPEKRNERIGAAMMGSTHVYDISTIAKAAATRAQPAVGDREGMVELALDPSELDLDNEAMAQRYEQQMREQQSHLQKEDLSDMLAEHVARQKSKRKRQQADTSKQTKKYKEFKF